MPGEHQESLQDLAALMPRESLDGSFQAFGQPGSQQRPVAIRMVRFFLVSLFRELAAEQIDQRQHGLGRQRRVGIGLVFQCVN